jgi:hypothetical protein
MSDSNKITLLLMKLALKYLSKLPMKRLLHVDISKETGVSKVTAKYQYAQSPLTTNGYALQINASPDGRPAAMMLSVNVPSATVGQNIEHALSVYAATNASFLLGKHYLATHGVPLEELDLLSLDDVHINQSTLTFLIYCEDTKKAMELITTALCTLHPDGKKTKGKFSEGTFILLDPQGNKTTYCNHRTCALHVYAKAEDLLTSSDHADFGRTHIRIELVLHGQLLKQRKWDSPEAWKDAHESGLYASIFEEFVQNKFFRLDENLRQARPDAADIGKLSGLSLKVLKGYMAGKDPRTASQFIAATSEGKRAEQKLFSQCKRDILGKLRLDITIPFDKHMGLNTAKVRNLMVWAGDHEPDISVSDKCFCKSNWSKLKAALEMAIVEACDKYQAKKRAAMPNIDPETGEIKNYLSTNSNGLDSQEIKSKDSK